MNHEGNNSSFEDSRITLLEKEFSDDRIPLKVRKLGILAEAGLPVLKTDIIERDDIGDLEQKLEERASGGGNPPLILRFACVPDKFSMPTFYLEQVGDLSKVANTVRDAVLNDREIASVIIQDATPAAEAPNKISGRALYEDEYRTGNELVLELYKGSRTTGILNRVHAEDSSLQRFIKPYGGFLRPDTVVNPDNGGLSKQEIAEVVGRIDSQYREAIELAKKVFLKIARKTHPVVSFEFWYRDGKMVFTDID